MSKLHDLPGVSALVIDGVASVALRTKGKQTTKNKNKKLIGVIKAKQK